MGKWEREANTRRMAVERRQEIEWTQALHERNQEIIRQRRFLKLIAEPLPIDVLSTGDFREIAQVLSKRIALAGLALSGVQPPAGEPDNFNPVGFATARTEAVTNGERV